MAATDFGSFEQGGAGSASPASRADTPSVGMRSVHRADVSRNRLVRASWIVLGSLLLGLGVIGIVVPGWPTTIFAILATACYARSSQRLYDRVIGNRLIGGHARAFRETGAMPRPAKAVALAVMWPFVGLSALIAIPDSMPWAKVATVALALAGTAYILWLPSGPRSLSVSMPGQD